jgi:hypothetical protein
MDTLHAAWKFLRSFFRSSWELSDYPIRVKQFTADLEPHGRLGPPFTWSAQIVNWWVMAGHGYSRAEAIQNLATSFARRKAELKPLPRPGTTVPFEFGSDERVRQHEQLAVDFMNRILGLRYEECFISDQSSLWDFHEEESNDFLNKAVLAVYGVDVSDLEAALIADILERIAAKSPTLPTTPLQPSSGVSGVK